MNETQFIESVWSDWRMTIWCTRGVSDITYSRYKKLPFNYKAYVVENRLLIKMKELWDYEIMIILPL